MKNKKNENKRFLKDSSIYFSTSIISAGINFLTLPIFTRYLSPADYGIVALFLMFGQVSAGLVSLGLQSASYRYYFKYKDNLDLYRTLNSSILIFLILVYFLSGLSIYYLADWFSKQIFNEKISGTLIQWSFLSGCLEYLFIYFTFILTAQLRSFTFSIISIARALILPILTIYFIFGHSLTYLSIIYATLITQVLMIICLVGLTANLIRIKFSIFYFSKALKFSYPMILRLGIGMIHKSFDKIMLTNFSNLSSVGYYSIGEKVASTLKVMMDSIGKVWNPYFQNKAYVNTKKSKEEIAKRYLEISFFIMFLGLSIICFSEEIIKLLTTEEFYPAMFITPVYIYYILFGIMGMISVQQIQFSEKTLYMLPASIVGVLINIILNIILIPKFGALGAVMSLSIAGLFSSLVHFYYGFKLYPVPLDFKKFIGMFVLILVFTIPVYPLMNLNINFLFKIFGKLSIITLFIISGFYLKFISYNKVRLQVKILNPLKNK